MSRDASATRPSWWDAVEHAAAAAQGSYPDECCGLVVSDAGSFLYRPCENEAAAPSRAFRLDPLELVRLEDRGESALAVVHSHPDILDDFSSRDRASATGPDGEPLHGQLAQVVISVFSGEATAASCYEWCSRTRRFERRFREEFSG